MYDFIYKDSDPNDTIKKCQNILNSLGFTFSEDCIQSSEHLFSVSLQEKNLGYFSNGKGSTLEYAKASAYAEFLERLQNVLFLKDWNKNTFGSSFNFYPDEVLKPWEILKNFPDLLKDLSFQFELGSKRPFLNEDEFIAYCKARFNNEREVLCANFYSLKKGEVLFPFEILSDLIYTSGMCAGNTPEEAIAQGLSEIFERWASFFCWSNNLTPPKIDRDFIYKKYPQQYSQIKEIESLNPNISLTVLDCSLGLGIPVVGVLLVDTNLHRFRVQYGAHIRFEVALERCLTEFLQGYDPRNESQNILNLVPLDVELDYEYFTKRNIHKLYNYSIGRVPLSFFTEKPSWEFKEWNIYENLNNKLFCKIMINKILEFAPDIYIRDNTYLGFPTYYIYVPSLSILPIPKSYKDFTDDLYEEEAYDFLENYENWDPNKKKAFCYYLISDADAYPIISNESLFPEQVFKLAILIENGFYEEALLLREFLPKNSKYEIIFFDLKLLLRCASLEQRQSLLSTFFNKEDYDFWNDVWSSCNNIVKKLIKLNNEISFEDFFEEVSFSNNKNLIFNYKNKMKENTPSQINLKEIL